jgi:hypothetical protein
MNTDFISQTQNPDHTPLHFVLKLSNIQPFRFHLMSEVQ